jgi:hypothetical protein
LECLNKRPNFGVEYVEVNRAGIVAGYGAVALRGRFRLGEIKALVFDFG